MTVPLLSILALMSLVVLLRAYRIEYDAVVYAAKPLTLLAIGLIAYFSWPPVSTMYQKAILVGLAGALLGDVLLMLPKDRFLAGLAAFLITHVAYGAAFVSRLELIPVLPFLPYTVASLFVLRLLWPHTKGVRFPVALYTIALAAMASLAFGVAMTVGGASAWFAAAGAALFVLSDAALAFDRFVGAFGAARTVILTTYFAGQWLIALSVGL
ncbi:MAG: lysoplasmalogenase [Rhodothermales bacterium]|nr:lysoplasmalogenase [Rhodothermales bacterium]MBO6780561.1 lysoplasmalogenase [Rhodothermales bacterium]